jgi:hypothetical protein
VWFFAAYENVEPEEALSILAGGWLIKRYADYAYLADEKLQETPTSFNRLPVLLEQLQAFYSLGLPVLPGLPAEL